MKASMRRSILWGVFAASAVLAAVDLLWFQGLFTWMFTAPLVLVTGIINAAVSLWNRKAKSAIFCLLVTLILCGAYALLLVWSLT